MKFILTICLLFFNLVSIHSQVLPGHLFQEWIKVAWHDPYNDQINHDKKEHIGSTDTLNYPYTIQFWENGEYVRIDKWNHYSGKWKWNQDSTKLGMNLLKANDKIYNDSTITEYRHYIYLLTKDSLIMGWQGRHGMVREFYIPRHMLKK
jgi:hypothetical protein